ncbi:hypothetical protein BJ742DRAFT_533305 [Cladochytrium replicatum]|nr:hypothetical protein BJ742DRAFT_533305 [Cladochytrium replicatum]
MRNQSRFRLVARAGASRSELKEFHFNDEDGVSLRSELCEARLFVRLKNFPDTNDEPNSSYFDQRRSAEYSIQIEITFFEDYNGDEVLFGNDFDRKLRLPPGASIGLSIVQYMIDPTLEADISSSQPWAYSPALTTMNVVKVSSPSQPHTPGSFIPRDDIPADDLPVSQTRGRYYATRQKREEYKFKKGVRYCFDFFNGYLSFKDFAILLPGFRVQVLGYWDGDPLRYILKARGPRDEKERVFLIVEFNLVTVDDSDHEDGDVATNAASENDEID